MAMVTGLPVGTFPVAPSGQDVVRLCRHPCLAGPGVL